jgi:hypothetical protein
LLDSAAFPKDALQGPALGAANTTPMEQSLVHIAATAAWIFVIVFIFALIGVYATIAWIVGLLRRGATAVESGVETIERKL